MSDEPFLESSNEIASESGWVAREVQTEFKGLGLRYVTTHAVRGKSSREIKGRLRDLSDRFRGANAIALRQEPVPWAYRVFFRHVGLDPDVDRTPIEAAAVERLMAGAFTSRGRIPDALLIALIETNVPIYALDADRLDGPVGIRGANHGESVSGLELPAGRLVVADSRVPVAALFGEESGDHAVMSRTERVLFYAVHVPGVPAIHVEEALWICKSVAEG